MERPDIETRVRGAMQRTGHHKPTIEEPPPALWDRIEAELSEPQPVDLASRRRKPWVWAGAAAAVVLAVVGIALGSTLTGEDSSEQEVASVELAPVDDGTGSGSAVLIDADGSLRLDVELADVDPGDGFLEVWLLDPDVTQLVSLGPARADGRYEVPDGLDVAALPVVDVSVEEFNGDPTHSGVSVLRGLLDV